MSAYNKLLEVQKEIKAIEKDSTNPHFKSSYFDINKLIADVKPILNEKGLVAMQPIDYVDGKQILRTKLVDAETGTVLEQSAMALPEQTDPQKLGSAITYYRRYALTSMLLLEAEDDDGEAATGRVQPTQRPTQTVKPPTVAAPSADWQSFVIPFGVHKGKTVAEAPESWKEYMANQPSITNAGLAAAIAGWKASKEKKEALPTINVDDEPVSAVEEDFMFTDEEIEVNYGADGKHRGGYSIE